MKTQEDLRTLIGATSEELAEHFRSTGLRIVLRFRKTRRYGNKGPVETSKQFYFHEKQNRYDAHPTYISDWAGEHLAVLMYRKRRKYSMTNTGPNLYKRHELQKAPQ